MKIKYRKKFLKGTLQNSDRGKSKDRDNFVFKELPKANSIFELGNIEQMKGYPSCYKIRLVNIELVSN